MNLFPNGNSRGGFTLLEVLASSAVLAVVLAVMLGALSTSLSLWRNTDNKIAADREARAVELLMRRDLANIVVPAAATLRPAITNSGDAQYLKFLTTAPAESQGSGERGDVCYVEYAVLPSTNGPGREVRRLFWPSGRTYTNVLEAGAFPGSPPSADFQSLGLYLTPANKMAARGLGNLAAEANDTNFLFIGTNMLPVSGYGQFDYPVSVEVNFAVADPATLANSNVITAANFILRNAGFYSFRLPLPEPPEAQ